MKKTRLLLSKDDLSIHEKALMQLELKDTEQNHD